jgi:hypothetical protein
MSVATDAEARAIPLVQIASTNTSANASPITGGPTALDSDVPPATLNGGPLTTNPSHRNGTASKQRFGFVKRDPAIPSPQWPTEVE